MASWRSLKIQSGDKGIFDPYVPIGSIKPLSGEYEPTLAQTADPAVVIGDDFATDQNPEKRSFMVFRLIVIAIGAIMAIRLINLQIVQGQQNYSLAEGNRLKTELVPAPRGLFYDRTGAPLVKNVPNFSVVFDLSNLPRKLTEREQFIERLAGVLSIDNAALSKRLKSNVSQITLIDNLNREQAMDFQLKFNQASINGVSLVALPVRHYGDVPDLGHLLGYIGKTTKEDLEERPSLLPTSYVGKNGLEQQYDKILQGTPGINTVEVDSLGESLRLVGSQPPTSGQSIILGLDSALQRVTATALQTAIQANKATSGAAVVMDVRTGEILAMASEPTFDNNLFSQSGNQADRQAVLTNPLSPLLNRVIAGQYPSGSTVKPIIAAGALQEGVVTASTKFDTSEPVKAGPQTFRDWKQHSISDIKLAIAQSNDIFFYTIGGGYKNITGLGVDRLDKYLQKYGFGSKTGLDLPGEKAGNVPTPEWKKKTQNQRWYLGDTYNLSIGQGGFLITPLQLTSSIAAIANGGTLYQPKMVKSLIDSTGKPKDVPPTIIRQDLVDTAHNNTVREGMRAAVLPGGTAASMLGGLPVETAAKTGTAQTSSSLTNTHAWFTAFAPYENPEIALSVVVEGGGGGLEVAGPVARQIIEQYFNLPLSTIVAAPVHAE